MTRRRRIGPATAAWAATAAWLASAGLTAQAQAQQDPQAPPDPLTQQDAPARRPDELRPAPPAPAIAPVAPPAEARPFQRAWRIVPLVGIGETYSDNVALAPEDIARSGWITDLAPGLRIERSGARLKVFLDTRVHFLRYSAEKQLDRTQRYLDGYASFEAVENWMYLDGRAAITQERRNPLGPATTPDTPSANPNQVETRIARFAPYVKGYFGDWASYRLQASATALRAEDEAIPRTRVHEVVARLRNASPSAVIGWTADASTLGVHNTDLGSLGDNRLRASLVYGITPQLHVSAIGGYDSTELAGPERRTGSVKGVGLSWNPSPRTQVAGIYERRFFGDAHNVLIQYRTPRTAWRAASIRDLTVLPNLLSSGGFGSAYNLMFDLLASAIPDPDARAAAARARLEESGLSATSPLSGSLLDTRPLLYRQHEMSGALIGPRDTFTLRFDQREQHAAAPGLGSGPVALFAPDTRETRYGAQWAHRLTPLSTLSLAATTLKVVSLADEGGHSRQREYTLAWTTQLGLRSTFSLAVRRVDFAGSSLFPEYRENAVVGLLTLRL